MFWNGRSEALVSRRQALIFVGIVMLSALAWPDSADARRQAECSGAGIPPEMIGDWVPEQWYVEIGQYEDGSRYILTRMVWATTGSFGAGSTFEADVFLNNYDKSKLGSGIYLDDSASVEKIPKVSRAESNLPNWYLDTRFEDPDGEVAFTIGSGTAEDILSNKIYYTLIVAPAGSTDTDNARVSAQVGCRDVASDNCTDYTWCTFAADTTDLVGDWELPAPGSAGDDPKLDIDVQQWCHNLLSDPEAVAFAQNPMDPYSWICETGGIQFAIDMNEQAMRQYGPEYCAEVVGGTAYDWTAWVCVELKSDTAAGGEVPDELPAVGQVEPTSPPIQPIGPDNAQIDAPIAGSSAPPGNDSGPLSTSQVDSPAPGSQISDTGSCVEGARPVVTRFSVPDDVVAYNVNTAPVNYEIEIENRGCTSWDPGYVQVHDYLTGHGLYSAKQAVVEPGGSLKIENFNYFDTVGTHTLYITADNGGVLVDESGHEANLDLVVEDLGYNGQSSGPTQYETYRFEPMCHYYWSSGGWVENTCNYAGSGYFGEMLYEPLMDGCNYLYDGSYFYQNMEYGCN